MAPNGQTKSLEMGHEIQKLIYLDFLFCGIPRSLAISIVKAFLCSEILSSSALSCCSPVQDIFKYFILKEISD